ncbi:MAG: hypothetical protein HYT93_04005 [Parcubacteria group bacterium]|nr:hypothetical protein [Parcubacteria group bacterium]
MAGLRVPTDKILTVRCHFHPRYTAERKSKTKCETCSLLYVLRWQYHKQAEEKLGSHNPFGFLNDVDGACAGVEARPLLKRHHLPIRKAKPLE